MGIDVDGYFQKKIHGKWKNIGSYYDGMRGTLRSWLAPWSNMGIEPIAEWRGFPPDWILGDFQPTLPGCCSWMMADEILDSLPVIQKITTCLSEEEFQKRKRKEYWDDTYVYDPHGILGKGKSRFITASRRPFEEGYTVDSWGVDIFFDLSSEVKDFTDKVLELKNLHGEIRFVFCYV